MVSDLLCAIAGFFSGGLLSYLIFGRNRISLKKFEEASDQMKAEKELFEISSEKQLRNLNESIEALQKNLIAEIEKRSKYECENQFLKESIEENQKKNDELMSLWRSEIENRTNNFVLEKSKKFEQHLEERLLAPLRENIDKFKRDVQGSFKQNSEEQSYLKEMLNQKVKDMIQAKDGIVSQAENLVNVFKKDYKSQGIWGELLLEKVLEESGLKRDVHYRVQPTVYSETDGVLRPDIIIDLTNSKHVIIDSKVSLVYFERFCSEKDAEQKESYRKLFIQSIKKQIDDLSSKHYQHAKGVNSPDFVLMFIPMEAAYSLIISCDENLHAYAWNKKRVALVSISNLMIAISVINRILSIELQNKNVEKVVSEAQKLYDKFVIFLDSMESLGSNLKRSGDLFEKAMSQLSSGRRDSIIGRIENLRELGINPTKRINENRPVIASHVEPAMEE